MSVWEAESRSVGDGQTIFLAASLWSIGLTRPEKACDHLGARYIKWGALMCSTPSWAKTIRIPGSTLCQWQSSWGSRHCGCEGLWWPDYVPRASIEKVGPGRGGQREGGTPVDLPAPDENGESQIDGVHIPLVVVDSKGKATETPSNKPQKKRKKNMASVWESAKKVEASGFRYVYCRERYSIFPSPFWILVVDVGLLASNWSPKLSYIDLTYLPLFPYRPL